MGGFVYVLSNESMPGIVKIGKTERHPGVRSLELFTTGVPEPYDIEFAVWVDCPDSAEKAIHDALVAFRVSDNREFFRVSPEVAVEKVCTWALGQFSMVPVKAWFEISDAHVERWVKVSGLHEWNVLHIMKHFSDEAIKAAAAKMVQEHEEFLKRNGYDGTGEIRS